MVEDGALEGFRCLAVEGARVGPDSGGGGRPGVGFGRGGGRLEDVTDEGGSVQPFVQGGAHVCPLSAHPCWALPLSAPVGSRTMTTCQECDPGTTVGGGVCL